MKIIIDKKEISTLTSIVYRAASSKSTVPILSGLYIQVSNNMLTLIATDMEIGIKASTSNVKIIEEGTILVHATYFADLIKLLPDTQISMELNKEKTRLNIIYGRSSSFINTYNEQEYPDLPINKKQLLFSIEQKVLKQALRKTSLAAAINHFRQVFTGVLFDIVDNKTLKIIASDTHRLAYYIHSVPEASLEPLDFIIPIRTVNELLRLLEDTEEEINVSISENNVIFHKNNFLLVSRLIEGKYPDYDRVIPKSFHTSIKVDSQRLLNTLERAKIMPSDEKLKIQHFQFYFNNKEATLTSYSELMGEIKEIIEEIEIEGNVDLKISFNTNYLLDAVKILESESNQINIELSGPLGPAMLKNSQKENYFYIIVPLRTAN